MLDKEEKPYLNTSAAIEYHGKSKSAVKPSVLLQRVLDRAAIIGDTDTINFIKDNGGTQIIEIKVVQALDLAIQNGQEGSSIALIEWGGSKVTEYVDTETLDTFLHQAALKGMSNTCTALLKQGSSTNIDARNRNKSTALHCAVASGDVNTVNVLLDAGASVKIKNDHKNTALALAKLHNQQEIISCLETNNSFSKSDKHLSTTDPLAPVSSTRISRIE